MSSVVVYYSFTGNTRKIAEEIAKTEDIPSLEIVPVKKPSKLKAYLMGSLAANSGKPWDIAPITGKLDGYDKIVLCSPIWAGNVPPFVHAAISQFPKGKEVECVYVSSSGKCAADERMVRVLAEHGCKHAGSRNVTTGKPNT